MCDAYYFDGTWWNTGYINKSHTSSDTQNLSQKQVQLIMKVNHFLAYCIQLLPAMFLIKNTAGSKTKGLWETEG
jgi:hypothetical protein